MTFAALINAVVALAILAILVSLAMWLLSEFATSLPTEISRVIRIAIVVVAVLAVVLILVGLMNGSLPVLFPHSASP